MWLKTSYTNWDMTWKQEEEIGKGYLHSLSPKCTCIELGSILLGTSTPNTNSTSCCCYSVAMSCLTLCDPMNFRHSRLPSFTMSWSLLTLTSIESVMLSGHPFLLLPSILPNIRVFSNESAFRIRWPKYWSFSISPSHEYSGLISFKIDWLDLLAVQGNLKSLLQHQRLKASILWHSHLLYGPTLTSIHT